VCAITANTVLQVLQRANVVVDEFIHHAQYSSQDLIPFPLLMDGCDHDLYMTIIWT
jgi:hypothetical protein